MKFSALIFMVLISGCYLQDLSSIHTIYISGPPVRKNKKWKRVSWFKQSKVLYDILKQEIERVEDNSIELFPKKEYRPSVIRDLSGSSIVDTSVVDKFLTQKELESQFKDLDSLLDDLVILIMKRHRELRDDFEELDEGGDKIHLIAHGRGGKLLSMLKESEFRDVIGSYIVFDGDDAIGNINSLETVSDEYKLGEYGFVDLALKSDGNLIINVDLAEMLGVSKSHKGEIIALATGIVGLIGGIIALF